MTIAARHCAECGTVFTPAPLGYNGRYCTGRCRNRARKKRTPSEVKRAHRQRRFQRTMRDPERRDRHRSQSSDNGRCIVRCANCHAIKTWREKQQEAQCAANA